MPRLWPRSTADRIREAFAFLVEANGYRLVAVSDGMGGSVTYRFDELWIAVEWDRGDPWLEFSPTSSAVGRFDWELMDHLLRSAPRFGHSGVPAREAPPEALAAWLREHLVEIQERFRPPAREHTHARLLEFDAQRRQLQEEYWASRDLRDPT